FQEKHPHVQQKWVQTLLRSKGWIVPSYELAPALETVEILRVVVRENVTASLIDKLFGDIIEVVEGLAKSDSPQHALAVLGQSYKSTESEHGNLKKGEGSESSGTYAKPC
ncbi:hypothetical protein EIP91_010542, partial [Steccherinum ochraceum]